LLAEDRNARRSAFGSTFLRTLGFFEMRFTAAAQVAFCRQSLSAAKLVFGDRNHKPLQ
jgi:hypothetical protein